jgi:hypothetical protein
MIIDSVSASRVPVSKRLSEISCPGFYYFSLENLQLRETNSTTPQNFVVMNFYDNLPCHCSASGDR